MRILIGLIPLLQFAYSDWFTMIPLLQFAYSDWFTMIPLLQFAYSDWFTMIPLLQFAYSDWFTMIPLLVLLILTDMFAIVGMHCSQEKQLKTAKLLTLFLPIVMVVTSVGCITKVNVCVCLIFQSYICWS